MKKKLIEAALILCMVLILAVPAEGSATSLSSITSESIKDKENQIDKAEEEKKALQNMLTDIKKLKSELESQKKDLKNYVAQLDKNLKEIQDKIKEMEALISKKEKEIEETEIQLAAARETEQQQYESMKVRMQMMYEQGDTYLLEVIFGGESFADVLNQMEYVEQVAAYDRRKLEEYMLNRELIELCKQELDAEKQVLDEAKAGVDAEKEALEVLIADKKAKITEYDADINNKEQAIKEYEEEVEAQEQLIADLEAAVEAERKRILAESGLVLKYDGGKFKFPLASYTRISDEYGMRMHPTLGIEKFHNGVDFAAPKGTAIYAAYDGVVVAASYSTTMGNYVMIDHGDGLYTIYMHASELYVKKDDIVARGETIAAVGSTGRSTGNHLHFSVRINGEYTSPWNYLSN